MIAALATQSLTELKLRDPAYMADPYPTLSSLRRQGAFAKVDMGILGSSFVALRYQDVLTSFTDERLSIDPHKRPGLPNLQHWWVPRGLRLLASSMLNLDNPDHRRLRRLVHKAFTPQLLKHIERDIESVTLALLDACAQKPVFDLVADFAVPLPLTIIAQLVGIPEPDLPEFSRVLLKLVDGNFQTPWVALRQIRSAIRMTGFLDQLVALRRKEPDTKLLSALIASEDAGDRLSTDELVAMLLLLLIAGFETSANMIGNGMLALLDHPEQLRLLTENPELMDSAVTELLRYDSPVHFPIARTALEDMEIGGRLLRKGESLLGLLGSANRDESVFPDADRLDITRTPNRHLGFGMGIHFCLGAQLARMEAKIALGRLLERFPNLRLAVPRDQLRWHMSAGFRGLNALPLAP